MKKANQLSMEVKTIKSQIRKDFIHKRLAISFSRRQEAAHQLEQALMTLLKPFKHILSFASLPDEIDLWSINTQLATTGRLFLPKVEGFNLKIFKVTDLKNELQPGTLRILEPIAICTETAISDVDCVLVPGLCFDSKRYRIGYGRGHYDRLLHPASHAWKIGVGYLEQQCDILPKENHDVHMDQLVLV